MMTDRQPWLSCTIAPLCHFQVRVAVGEARSWLVASDAGETRLGDQSEQGSAVECKSPAMRPLQGFLLQEEGDQLLVRTG